MISILASQKRVGNGQRSRQPAAYAQKMAVNNIGEHQFRLEVEIQQI